MTATASPVICARCRRLLGYESRGEVRLGADGGKFTTSIRYECPCGWEYRWSRPKPKCAVDKRAPDSVDKG